VGVAMGVAMALGGQGGWGVVLAAAAWPTGMRIPVCHA
jgi:hypothetical protein